MLKTLYHMASMAFFIYLMILAWCIAVCTDYTTPLLWVCEQFEWHWEML